MSVLDKAIVRVMPAVPKPVVRRISARYIAGTELEDACRVVRNLNTAGKMATIDVLGEEITRADEARAISRTYSEVFDTISEQGLDSNVSVKLTGLGLKLDYGLCRENLDQVLAAAAAHGNFVRIDMEDSSTTDDTLRLYRELREAGHDNVGIVLQACLRRTHDDIRALADLGLNVRLCKGIYVELRRSGRCTRGGSSPSSSSSRCCSACGRRWERRSSGKATGCASTSPSGASGTRTRCAGCRRTRASPGTLRSTRSVG